MFTLHNGDCLEVLPTIPSRSIDAIITDLPYGATACAWDEVIPFESMWKEVKRVLKPSGVFVSTAKQPFTSVLICSNIEWFKVEWIWHKNRAQGGFSSKYSPMKNHENIVVFCDGTPTFNKQMQKRFGDPHSSGKFIRVPENMKSNIYGLSKKIRYTDTNKDSLSNPVTVQFFKCVANQGKQRNIHSTQKPVALYEYLIKTYTNEGETVLDIAMGSGTTIEAAERTGRNSIGIEKDEGIFQSAVLRLKPLTPSNNRLQPTAFGVGTQAQFPLLGGTQAEESSATFGGG